MESPLENVVRHCAPVEPNASDVQLASAFAQIATDALFATDEAGCIAFVNPAAEAMFGWTLPELVGRTLHESLHFKRLDGTASAASDCAVCSSGHRAKPLRHHEDWFIHKNGGFVPVLCSSAQSLRNGRMTGRALALHDLSPRKRTEAAVAATNALLFQHVPDAVYVADASGSIRSNAQGLSMLGYNRREEQTGQQCDMLPEELNPRSAETGQRLAAGEQPIAHALSGHSTVREVIVRHRETGEDRIIRYAAAPITVDNAVVGAVAIGTDVTERRAAESEEKRRAAFEQQLIGIVSHDLRNPLHTIRLSATHGLRSVSEAGQRRVLERIVLASNRAGRMIDDLLDFTSVRFGGGLGVQRKPVNLHVLVAQVVDEMVATRPERRVATEVSGDGGGLWDEDRLVQVLQNLVGNALQHTSEDVAVRVRTRGDAERVILDVHNGGPPIASDDLPSLFEPFQRGRGARSGAGRSMGLGLYITCHIVQAHGGTVTVRSTSEEGTTFTVTLPRHEKGAV